MLGGSLLSLVSIHELLELLQVPIPQDILPRKAGVRQ